MSNFQRGDRVEIVCNDEGFKGSYYPATILAKINAGEYMIQYDTLLTEDELAPLREMVRAGDIRPIPPEKGAGDEGFGVTEKVDAFANGGWWMGRVTHRLGGRERLYRIFFEESGESGGYRFCDLRVHQDWVNAKWTTCIKS